MSTATQGHASGSLRVSDADRDRAIVVRLLAGGRDRRGRHGPDGSSSRDS